MVFFDGKIFDKFLDDAASVGVCSPLNNIAFQDLNDELQLIVMQNFHKFLNHMIGIAIIHEFFNFRTYLHLN